MFAYARTAIDFWAGWMTESQYLQQLKDESHDTASAFAEYHALKEKAFALAAKVGWEGDIRTGPFIAGLPAAESGGDGNIMIAWKQDNNGDTFVVSPFKLGWLEGGDHSQWVEG